MLAWYHWHPFELRALVCGAGAGLVVGFRAGGAWMHAKLEREWRNSDVAKRIEAIRQAQEGKD